MADTREKLIEAINDFFGCDAAYCGVNPLDLATHLIANGVTVQKERYLIKENGDIVPLNQVWIPVTQRVPTEDDATEQGAILAWEVSVKHWDIWEWACVRDYSDRFIAWMPLPEPPKAEET